MDINNVLWIDVKLWEMNMRNEDIQAIKRALAILRVECQEHKSCSKCSLYKDKMCILDRPPMHYDTDAIIKCFT